MIERFARILLITTIILLWLWLLPWTYRFLTGSSARTPFTLYSSVIHDFAILDTQQKETKYTDSAGNIYTENQFDSILPFFYYRQLMSQERLPDSLSGVALSPRLIRQENFIFRSTPLQVSAKTVPLYPLLESMSGRVDLEIPDDVFRMNHRMEFIDMAANRVNEIKSKTFTDMLLKKGFVFPAKIIAGNPTVRKEYDEGYLITDAENKLFHVKQIKGKPYVRFIEMPTGLVIKQIYLTEFNNRKFLAFFVDEAHGFWVLTTKTYKAKQVAIPAFDPQKMSLSIIANMFDWTITVQDGMKESIYAVDAKNFNLIKSMERTIELSRVQKTEKYLFPVRLEFGSKLNKRIFPAFKLNLPKMN